MDVVISYHADPYSTKELQCDYVQRCTSVLLILYISVGYAKAMCYPYVRKEHIRTHNMIAQRITL